MARFRCYCCRCSVPGKFHEFEADAPACPKCGAGEPAVIELCDVHFLLPDQGGPVVGEFGRRYKVVCEPGREVLATSIYDDYAASGDPRATTCRSCKGVLAWRQAASHFKEMRAALREGGA